MPSLTIKNIPDDVYEELKRAAARHRRSVNSEAIVCFERALRSVRLDPRTALSAARALRTRAEGVYVTDTDLELAKRSGRP